MLLVEQKSRGRSLAAARAQALEYFDALAEHERPRYLLLCDFQNWELIDLDLDEEIRFQLEELPEQIDRFGFMMGVHRRAFRDQDPVNIQASELVGAIHDELRESGYAGEDLDRFLVRIVFCLFADDTGIFERESFLSFLEDQTTTDGADIGVWLDHLFTTLNKHPDERSRNLPEQIAAFPLVNGDLFAGRIRTADFDAKLRQLLIEAARFDWSQISPAIFGALFQSVMSPTARRAIGAHYTTEQNILKVIEPLFLDELRAEFERIKSARGPHRRSDLRSFQLRLGEMTFFDPACGCGNFLIIAYRELRQLEIEVLLEMYGPKDRTAALDVSQLSVIDVDQFYGIEIQKFPAKIAEVALWMMDHIMNVRLSEAFGQYYARIPLQESPNVVCADALDIDWEDVLPARQCNFVFGNPPFSGFVYSTGDVQQRAKQVMKELGAGGSRLDYVAAWFLKAGRYLREWPARIGFVATNSITQGEQVGQLWPALFGRYELEITFAHSAFAWGSDARGMAHVHVVVIGLADRKSAPSNRRLFSYDAPDGDPYEVHVNAISPYLFDASDLADPHFVVKRRTEPVSDRPRTRVGTKPVDGGHYLLSDAERADFLAREPHARPLVRPFLGSEEFINGKSRWIIHVGESSPAELRGLPAVMDRIKAVTEYRGSAGKLGQSLADRPTEYHVTTIPEANFLVVPESSSSRRAYVPIGWLSPPTLPSNALHVIEDATLDLFAFLTSAMHMAWLSRIGGRLKSDYRYSRGLVYDTFPLLDVTKRQRDRLTELAQAILDARATHPNATLADLYDPDVMPADLRRAHTTLDRYVDRLYRPRVGFDSERERVEHLLARYEQMIAPLDAAQPRPNRRRRRTRP